MAKTTLNSSLHSFEHYCVRVRSIALLYSLRLNNNSIERTLDHALMLSLMLYEVQYGFSLVITSNYNNSNDNQYICIYLLMHLWLVSCCLRMMVSSRVFWLTVRLSLC